MFETMIRGMYESGIRPRPYRTNGKPDGINGKLDALIEGQKETNDNLKGINDNLKGGLKEINEALQEIRDKVWKWRTADPGASVTPGLACVICHPSCAIRRRVCGLLSGPTCPDSPGIHALGRRRRPSGRPERRASSPTIGPLEAGRRAPTATSSPRREAAPCVDAAGGLHVVAIGLRDWLA